MDFMYLAKVLVYGLVGLSLCGCTTLKQIRDRFHDNPTRYENESITNALNCVDLNSRSSAYKNNICIDDSYINYFTEAKIVRYERNHWEEYLGNHVKRWLSELRLKTDSETDVSVYAYNLNRFTNTPYLYIDVENPSWLIRFGVPYDPNLWQKNFTREFFLDRAFVTPRPFAGNIIVEWKNQNALKEIEDIIPLYSEAKVSKKQGLTWSINTEITEWQDFAGSFLTSPYVKERIAKWRVTPYSSPATIKHKLVQVELRKL